MILVLQFTALAVTAEVQKEDAISLVNFRDNLVEQLLAGVLILLTFSPIHCRAYAI
jgi:hypothetical protein